MNHKRPRSTVQERFWREINTTDNGLSTIRELTRGKSRKLSRQRVDATSQRFSRARSRPSTAVPSVGRESEAGGLQRGQPYSFFSKVGGSEVALTLEAKKGKLPKADNFLLKSRLKASDADTRAITAMNTIQIDKEIDSNLYKFGKTSSSTNEIEHKIRSHKYVMSKKKKKHIPLENKIRKAYMFKKQENIRPYTASALLTDKQQVRITTPFSQGNKKQSVGELLSEDVYKAKLRELNIQEDPAESDDSDSDELDNVEELRRKFGVKEEAISRQPFRRPMTSTETGQRASNALSKVRPDSKMKARPLSGLTLRRPISGRSTFRPENYFTNYNKEVTNVGDEIPFEELFDRNERTLCATFAKFGNLSYHTPNRRIGTYYQYSSKLKASHLREVIALQNTITTVEKNENEIPIQLAIVDEMNPFQKRIKTGISSIFKKEEVEREPITNSLFPEYFEDSSEEEEEDVEEQGSSALKAAEKYFSRQLEEMGGRYDPTFLGCKNYMHVDLRFVDPAIRKKVELSFRRFCKYVDDESFIRNTEIATYNRVWMSEALKRVAEPLLRWDEDKVRGLFHEIFGDYRTAVRRAIMEYLLRCPEERKRLYIDLLVRETPTSSNRICNAGGYSVLLYGDWHAYVENCRSFLSSSLYAMNIVNSSLLDWNEDFRHLKMVETRITRFMAVCGQAMKLESFLKVQQLYRAKTRAFMKHVWLRGAYLIMKKFKFFRVSKEKRGCWTFAGRSFQNHVESDFLDSIVDINIRQKEEGTEDEAEVFFHAMSCSSQEKLGEMIEMPLSDWAGFRLNDLQDIRDSPAYNFYALVNDEPLLLEENGYKLLDKEVKNKLRRSVGAFLALQLREKVRLSILELEDLILTIPRYQDSVQDFLQNQQEFQDPHRDTISESLNEASADYNVEEENSIYRDVSLGGGLPSLNINKRNSSSHSRAPKVSQRVNTNTSNAYDSYSQIAGVSSSHIGAGVSRQQLSAGSSTRRAGASGAEGVLFDKLGKLEFKFEVELEMPEFMAFQNLFSPFLKLQMIFNGNELKFSEEEEWVKAMFVKMHEEVVTSFADLPHPEYVSINVLDETVEQHMEQNYSVEKDFDSFYQRFMPFIDMTEKTRKKKVQSMLETMQVEEVDDKDKVLRINNVQEELYVNSSERISQHVACLYKDASRSFLIFQQLKPVYERKYVKKVNKFIENERPWTDPEFKDHFVGVNAYIDLVHQVPDSLYFPLFEIDTISVKEYLLGLLHSLRDNLQAKATTFLHAEINKIREGFERLGQQMAESVGTAEEYEKMDKFMDQLNHEKVLLGNKSTRLFERIIYISNLHIEKINDTFSKARELFQCPDILETQIRSAELKHEQSRRTIVDEIDREKLEYKARVIEIEEALFENEGMTDFGQYSVAIRTFEDIDSKIGGLESLKTRIMEEETRIYKKPSSQYLEAQALRDNFVPIIRLWRSVDAFMTKKNGIFDSKVGDIDIFEVEKLIKESEVDQIKISKRIPDRDSKSKVVKRFREEINYLKQNQDAISVICNQGLQERHWEKIGAILPFDFDHRADDLTTLLEEDSLLVSIEQIRSISEKATKEFNLERQHKAILADWKDQPFTVTKWRGGDITVLQGASVDEIQGLLEDHVNKYKAITSHPAIKFMEGEANSWQEKLQLLQSVLDIWVEVQTDYIYLEPIFDSEDIKTSLRSENSQFEVIHKKWVEITGFLEQDPQALSILEIPNLESDLEQSRATMQKIKVSLDDYLNLKRTRFPRFYFISNEEMLMILNDTKNPLLVQPHLKKCFSGIERLVFTPDDEIIGMRSALGETIDFNNKVVPKKYKGAVEEWLIKIEEQMEVSLITRMEEALDDLEDNLPLRAKWIRKQPGQCVLACSQISWTHFVEENIKVSKKMKELLAVLNAQLEEIVGMVRGELSPAERISVGALIVVEVHAKDIVHDLIFRNREGRVSQKSKDDFSWQSQLRYYYSKDSHKVSLSMVDTNLEYGYEYLGNSGRLVITPLTDRCYRTLMSALHLNLGGAPEGPAGTGKTETTKDLAKAVALQCVVFNCSKGLKVHSMGKFFTGLVTTGAWSCFDEFNRIELEVLSVIAQQILSIQQAKAANLTEFMFEGTMTRLRPTCNIFITMNPGYAGRSSLPDNLKVLFRPVAMMVPDYADIAEISLYSLGFMSARELAVKIVATYRLCSEQLSAQYHYDYGMRAVKSVLVTAGQLKRNFEGEDEEVLIFRAIKEANLPKFLQKDIPIFELILKDLFPTLDAEHPRDAIMKEELTKVLSNKKLPQLETLIAKVFQLYDIINTRHGLMLVGEAMSGKSSIYQLLAETLNSMNITDERVLRARYEVLNPKSITLSEIYGYSDPISKEWTEGLVAEKFKRLSKRTQDRNWVVFDGPVDADWIENMNTVLDDNKVLCLMNSDKIPLSPTMTVMFETDSLSRASPATVSRCGMVYVPSGTIGGRNLYSKWLETSFEETFTIDQIKYLQDLFDTLYIKAERQLAQNSKQLHEVSETVMVENFTRFLGMVLKESNLAQRSTLEMDLKDFIQKSNALFVHSLAWTLGVSVVDDHRKPFDRTLRQMVSEPAKSEVDEDTILKFERGVVPPENRGTMIIDYLLDFETYKWKDQSQALAIANAPDRLKNVTEFYDLTVETEESLRIKMALQYCRKNALQMLLIGPTGIGKTQIVQSEVKELPSDEYMVVSMSFSAKTQSLFVRSIVESKVERKRTTSKGSADYGLQQYGQKGLLVIDDLNLPAPDNNGFQGVLELLRQFFEYGGWYDSEKLIMKRFLDFCTVSAMGPPGGNRSAISMRLMRYFYVYTSKTSDVDTMETIFKCISHWFWQRKSLPQDSLRVLDFASEASVDLFYRVIGGLKATPQKPHYLFNMRDVSKVFQGIELCDKIQFDSSRKITRLWLHETWRVFGDRLFSEEDRAWLYKEVKHTTELKLREDLGRVFQDLKESYPELETSDNASDIDKLAFSDIVSDSIEIHQRKYVEEANILVLVERCEDYLVEFNLTHNYKLNVCFFEHAVRQMVKICRILKMDRGNAVLLGLGGSGRQTLTRVGAFVMGQNVIDLKITKGYGVADWKEDVQKVLNSAALEGGPACMLLTENQVSKEYVMQDIDALLNMGEIPNLYSKDEFVLLEQHLRELAKKEGNQKVALSNGSLECMKYFISKIRKNLHIVVVLSSVGSHLRVKIRNFPSIVNCCSMINFTGWPDEALHKIAVERIDEFLPMQKDEEKEKMVSCLKFIHNSSIKLAEEYWREERRKVYITPSKFLEFIENLKKNYEATKSKIEKKSLQYRTGLEKIDETQKVVKEMSIHLDKEKPKLEAMNAELKKLQVMIDKEEEILKPHYDKLSQEEAKMNVEFKKTEALREVAEEALSKVKPAFDKAQEKTKNVDIRALIQISSYKTPGKVVRLVMACVCIVFGKPPLIKDGEKDFWPPSKALLGSGNLPGLMKGLKPQDINVKALNQVRKDYSETLNMTKKNIKRAAEALWPVFQWIKAIDMLEGEYRKAKPAQDALDEADKICSEMKAKLELKREECAKLQVKIKDLQKQQRENQNKRNKMEESIRVTQLKFERANILIEALGEEEVSWTHKSEILSKRLPMVKGDSLLSAAILTYFGPFSGAYLGEEQARWMESLEENRIRTREGYTLEEVVGNPMHIMKWTMKGLPNDIISRQKALTVFKVDTKYPLMIDPQGQAAKWIRNVEVEHKIKSTRQDKKSFISDTRNALEFGSSLIIENCLADLDSILYPILLQQSFKTSGVLSIKLGDETVDFNKDFRLFMATTLANPHYTPEVTAKVNVINFMITREGLEDQLLQVTVRNERPDIEEHRRQLIEQNHENNMKMEGVEQDILATLQNTEGDILENEDAINTLKRSKEISVSVTEKQENQRIVQAQTEESRKVYTQIASHGAVLFFCCNHMARISDMYQYSLKWFLHMFEKSLKRAEPSSFTEQRTENVNKEANKVIYSNICRGLYEKDKLVFSLIMALNIAMKNEKVSPLQLRVLTSELDLSPFKEIENPLSNISEAIWLRAQAVAAALGDRWIGLPEALEKRQIAWETVIQEPKPEMVLCPEPFNDVQGIEKVLLYKVLRPDTTIQTLRSFVGEVIGQYFVKPPAFDLEASFQESNCNIPIVFLLPGIDPMAELSTFAERYGKYDMKHVSLGQGQGVHAENAIAEARESGNWVILENCHLYASWMPQLARICEDVQESKSGENIHRDFRLFLTTYPCEEFPHNILQNSIKLANQPPEGLGTNMMLSYCTEPLNDEAGFLKSHPNPKLFGTLVYSLCFFHAIIQERRNYGPLGWTIPYEFSMSDLKISLQNLFNFTSGSTDNNVPYNAIYYMIGECNYGGRVTDHRDRLLLKTLLEDIVSHKIFYAAHHFADLDDYKVPEFGDREHYLKFIDALPSDQPPELFGLHKNALISKALRDTQEVSLKLISVFGGGATGGGNDENEGILLKQVQSLLDRCPSDYNVEFVAMNHKQSYEESMDTILIQEITKYNRLLNRIRETLLELQKAIKGETVMNDDLEEMGSRMLSGLVPALWKEVSYLSIKPLGGYFEDLLQRIEFMEDWIDNGMPKAFWISGFFFAHGFMTAVLQNYSRREKIPIDKLKFTFQFLNVDDNKTMKDLIDTIERPVTGSYIYGLFLEGCGWDKLENRVIESTPGQLYEDAPLILLIPAQMQPQKRFDEIFHCPVYLTPEREGKLNTSGRSTNFLTYVDMQSHKSPSHWIKRGAALLSQLKD